MFLLATIILGILKLSGLLNIGWLLVLAPVVIQIFITLCVVLVALIISFAKGN